MHKLEPKEMHALSGALSGWRTNRFLKFPNKKKEYNEMYYNHLGILHIELDSEFSSGKKN